MLAKYQEAVTLKNKVAELEAALKTNPPSMEDELQYNLANFDWYYEMSDDSLVWRSGQRRMAAIQASIKENGLEEKLLPIVTSHKYRSTWIAELYPKTRYGEISALRDQLRANPFHSLVRDGFTFSEVEKLCRAAELAEQVAGAFPSVPALNYTIRGALGPHQAEQNGKPVQVPIERLLHLYGQRPMAVNAASESMLDEIYKIMSDLFTKTPEKKNDLPWFHVSIGGDIAPKVKHTVHMGSGMIQGIGDSITFSTTNARGTVFFKILI